MSSWRGERESSSGEAAVEEVVAVRELTHASPDGGDQVVGVGQSAVDRGRVSQTRTLLLMESGRCGLTDSAGTILAS